MPESDSQKESSSNSLPVIVIGGVYEYGGGHVTLLGTEFPTDSFIHVERDGQSWAVLRRDLTGPISMPCPICGEIVQVVDREGDNDLQNHLFWKCKTTPQEGEGK